MKCDLVFSGRDIEKISNEKRKKYLFCKNKTKKDWKNITICATIISIINKLKNIMEKERRI